MYMYIVPPPFTHTGISLQLPGTMTAEIAQTHFGLDRC